VVATEESHQQTGWQAFLPGEVLAFIAVDG